MYSENIWNNGILIPLWVAHLTMIPITIAVLAVKMMENAGNHEGKSDPTLTAFMVLSVVALTISPLEMVFKSSRYLDPWLYLGFHVYKVGFSIIFTILEIVEYAQQQWMLFVEWYRYLDIILIAVAMVMVITFVASLTYGAIVVHRQRKAPSYGFVKERYQDDDGSTHMASGAIG